MLGVVIRRCFSSVWPDAGQTPLDGLKSFSVSAESITHKP